MKLKEQVLSVEQARHLQELGLDMTDAGLCFISKSEIWKEDTLGYLHKEDIPLNERDWKVLTHDLQFRIGGYEYVPTYTLQEVLGKLPVAIKHKSNTKLRCIDDIDCRVWYEDYRYSVSCFAEEYGESLLEAAYKMLCWVIKRGYLKEK